MLRERLVSREPSPGTNQIYQPPGVDLKELADLLPIREDSERRVSIMRDAISVAIGEDLKGTSYLDLGCNTGFFCRSFASLGMNSHGIDVVADDIVTARLIDTYFSRKPSIWTVADGVDFIERQSGFFDVVS